MKKNDSCGGEQLRCCLVFFIIILLFASPCFAEQISKKITLDKDNKYITIIEYTNEKDGLIKAEYYGDYPNYTDKIYYYDKSNKDYYERCEFHNIVYSPKDVDQYSKCYAVYYMQKDNPLMETKVEVQYESGLISTTYYYIPGNTYNLLYEIVDVSLDRKITRKFKKYEDQKKTDDNISDCSWFFDSNDEVIKTIVHYFENTDGAIERVDEYSSPLFCEKDGLAYKTVIQFKNNPDGFIQQTIIHDNKGLEITENLFNSAMTKYGYNRVFIFLQGKTMIRQVQYFDEKPYKGRIYSLSIYYNEDETVAKIQFFDKDGQEIQQ
jgi:hypothetical protein